MTLPGSHIGFVASALEERGVTLLAFDVEDLAELEVLPLLHKDPFDRALVAQARRHSATLVTVDRVLSSYDVKVLWD